jgi:hypothetical protein
MEAYLWKNKNVFLFIADPAVYAAGKTKYKKTFKRWISLDTPKLFT